MPSDKRQRQRENAAARAAALRASKQKRANRRRALVGGLAIAAIVAVIAILVVSTSGGGTNKAASTGASGTSGNTGATGSSGTTPTTASSAAPPMAPPVPAGKTITGVTPCPNPDGSSPRVSHFAMAPPSCIDGSKTYTATFDTTQGPIVVVLNTPQTAGTVNNFVTLALYHYYDGSSFDRIDQSIDIIQGGSPSTQTIADPGPGYMINDEGHFTTDSSGTLHGPYTYTPGDLVMARGSGPKSASAQYFFVVGPKASALNATGTYVVFGHVTQGLATLQHIETALYQACPASDQTCIGGGPKVPVIVNKITIAVT